MVNGTHNRESMVLGDDERANGIHAGSEEEANDNDQDDEDEA